MSAPTSSSESNATNPAAKASAFDLEVKDAQIIFNAAWNDLEAQMGRENLRFPKEIFWLNGGPGAGKGTQTEFIMKLRGYTAAPVMVSSLLSSPEAKRMIDAGMMVGDKEVTGLVFRRLLDPEYQSGAVVDGFPRTKVQVHCLKMFYTKLVELHNSFAGTALERHFFRPNFHIIVLFVDEAESVDRQLKRGHEAIAHNEQVRKTGMGELIETRKTDLSPEAARSRYRTFKEVTYEALKSLREVFQYHFINANENVEKVQESILEELRYQSGLELDQATFNAIRGIPTASEVLVHCRQEMVMRLDSYTRDNTKLFLDVLGVIKEKMIPIIRIHAISGVAHINSEEKLFNDPLALEMLVDVFSERGFHAAVDVHKIEIPDRFDLATGKISTRTKRVYRFSIRFAGMQIRRDR